VFYQRDPWFVPDRAVGPYFVVVSAPVLHFFVRASSRLMKQWVFRHSARNLALKLSMNALSVGLPGREKPSVTPFW